MHKPPRRRSSPPPQSPQAPVRPPVKKEPFIVVSLADAKMWAKFAAGPIRAALWADVVKRMERIEATGAEAECRWWSAARRPHPAAPSHGALEVVRVELPCVRVRKRGRE